MGIVRAIKNRLAVAPDRSAMPTLLDDEHYAVLRRMPALEAGQVDLFGRPFAFSDAPGFLHSLQEIFVEEVYRFDSADAVPHIIDAGANIGLSVLYFKRLHPGATVIGYEPDPAMFALLERNTRHLDGVELHQAAAWTADTELTFYQEGSLAGSTEVDFLNTGSPITVRAERLKDRLADRPVSFLKIDIEGAENEVLFDIADSLDRVDLLFFEYHSAKGKPQQLGRILDLVSAAGFRYAINGCHAAARPFVETMPMAFDLQLNVSCFRQR